MKAMEALLDIRTRMKEIGERNADHKAAMSSMEARMIAVESALQRRPGASVPGTGVDSPGSFSFKRAILGIITGEMERHAPYEREVMLAARETAYGQRAASLANDESLGFLVPTEVVAEIVPLLRSKMILEQLGVTFLEDLGGSPVEITRETAGGTGYWVGENSAITDSDQKTDVIRLRPHKAGALSKISNTLLRTGGNRSESFVRNSLMKTLARTIQTAFFSGTGSDGQPLGILNDTSILSTDHGSNALTFIALQQVLEEIEAADGDIGSIAWAMHPRLKGAIQQLVRISAGHATTTAVSANDPLFFPGDPSKGAPPTLLGWPILTTTDLPITSTGSILAGVWETAILGSWGAMELAATREAGDAFVSDQTYVKVVQEVDVGVTQGNAIHDLQNVNI